jgi:hypothetical protein
VGTESLLIGSPFDLFVGFYGLLLAPGKGLLIYALPVLLGAIGFAAFWRAHRSEALLLASVILATILGVVLWRDWSGGWCWGPRLILNIVPLAIIPAAAAIERGPLSKRTHRWIWPAIFAVGVFTQVLGVLPNYLSWYMRVGDGYAVYYDPTAFPVLGHLQLLLEGKFDLFWLRTEVYFPDAGSLMLVLFGILALATIAIGLQMVRAWRSLPLREEDIEVLG